MFLQCLAQWGPDPSLGLLGAMTIKIIGRLRNVNMLRNKKLFSCRAFLHLEGFSKLLRISFPLKGSCKNLHLHCHLDFLILHIEQVFKKISFGVLHDDIGTWEINDSPMQGGLDEPGDPIICDYLNISERR